MDEKSSENADCLSELWYFMPAFCSLHDPFRIAFMFLLNLNCTNGINLLSRIFPDFFPPELGTSGEINTTLRKQTNGKALRTHLCFEMRISSSKCLKLLCAITAPAIPVNGRRFISNFKIPSRKLVKTSRKWIYFTANRVVSQTKLLSHSQSSPVSSKNRRNETGMLCNKQQSWTPQW